MRALKRLERARTALIMSQPFFGCLALRLTPVERADLETMATDGASLFYSPAFVESLSEPELIGVLVHEILHCAYLHFARRGHRDLKQWNVSTDYAINRDVLASGFRLPADALHDPAFDGLGAEEIHARLFPPKEKDPARDPAQAGAGDDPGGSNGQAGGGQASMSDPGRCGGILDAAPAHDPAATQAAAADWETAVRQAVAVAKARNAGNVPGELARIVAELDKPRVDWRETLRRFIDESSRREYSWNRPNRRYAGSGFILPGTVADGMSRLVVIVDTSGSIDDSALASFAAELESAFQEGAAERLSVVYADTRVHRVDEFEAGDVVRIKAKGGGGTDFADAFRWIAREAPDASAVLFFTDLKTRSFGDDPGAPVLWAVWGDSRQFDTLAGRVPFGECLYLAA